MKFGINYTAFMITPHCLSIGNIQYPRRGPGRVPEEGIGRVLEGPGESPGERS